MCTCLLHLISPQLLKWIFASQLRAVTLCYLKVLQHLGCKQNEEGRLIPWKFAHISLEMENAKAAKKTPLLTLTCSVNSDNSLPDPWFPCQ